MQAKSGARYALYALALLTAINLLSYINRNVIFALFQSIERDLHLTDFHAGWLASAYVVVYSLAALPLGILSDLRSRRAVVAGGIGLWSVFTILAGLAQGFGQLILCRAAVGIGGAAAAAAGASLVADYFPDRRRAVAMGVYMAGIPLGGVLGILAGGELEGVYGWRLSFVAVGLPGFLLALLVAQLRDPTRPPARLVVREYLEQIGLGARTVVRRFEPSIVGVVVGAGLAWYLDHRLGADSALDMAAFAITAGTGFALNIRRWVLQVRAAPQEGAPVADLDVMQVAFEEVLHAARVVLRTPTLVYIFVGGALISFGMNGLVGWAPTFMSRELDLSVRTVSVLIGKWGLVFGIAGTICGGLVADWLRSYTPTARVLTSGLGFVLGAPFGIWLLTIRDLDLFIPVFCVAFFFLTWYNGPLSAAIFDVVPSRISATVVGAYLTFIHLAGDAIAFPLVGLLSDRFGIDRAVYLLPIAALTGGLVIFAALRSVGRDMDRAARVTGEWRVTGPDR